MRGSGRRAAGGKPEVERVQTGVRIERRMLKVLKALAEYHDLSLGDLIEGIVLHAFDGRPAFGAQGRARIRELKRLYGLYLDASHSHALIERSAPAPARARGGARRTSRRVAPAIRGRGSRA
jgi:hypothetical protein